MLKTETFCVPLKLYVTPPKIMLEAALSTAPATLFAPSATLLSLMARAP